MSLSYQVTSSANSLNSNSLVCHAYESEFIQGFSAEDNEFGLHLWCLDRESKPIHIIINKPPIYLYIELPENPLIKKWDEDAVDLLYQNFRKTHGKVAPFMMEYTEREKIYYYNNNETTPMARLFFKTPRDMNICKSRLMKTQEYNDFGGMIFRVFENDISVKRKVFTIRRTRYCQWFEFDGIEVPYDHSKRTATKGRINREIREYIVTDYNDIVPIDPKVSASWKSQPWVLSFDIETYSDNPHGLPDKTKEKHVIYMISCLYQQTGNISSREKYIITTEDSEPIEGVTILKAEDEENLLVMFYELVDHLDPEIMMGYNIFAYDYPYIDARYSMRRANYEPCSRLQGHIPEMVNMTWASGAYGQTIISYLKMPGRISIDLFPLIKRDYKFDKYTLDHVSNQLLGANKHDVTAQQMFKAYESKNKKEMTRVMKYCIQDANLVLDLYEKMNVWIGLVEMSNIVGVEIMELFTRGQQIRCVSQIYDLTARKRIVLNSRDPVEIDFKGGFVGDPDKGVHENVLCMDFASLYPSIMRAYNICHTTLVPAIYVDDYDPEDLNIIDVDGNQYCFVKDHIKKGILPQLVENLVNERALVRSEMKRLEKRKKELEQIENPSQEILDEISQIDLTLIVLEMRQKAIKVSANSMYGFLGVSTGGKLPLKEGAVSITAVGRKLIGEVNDYVIKKYNAHIVYGDTDSSMFTIPECDHPSKCDYWGKRISEEISGVDEVKDAEGNIIVHGKRGLFPPPLKMEFEKAMRFLGITKKKYAAFLIAKDGSFKLDRSGEEEIYKRGIVIARRDNFPYLRKKYTEILKSILRKNPIEHTFKMILDAVLDIISGSLPVKGNLTIIRGLGKEYSSDTYFMKVFSDELARMGHPVAAGDRLEYVVVEGDDPKMVLGRRMRLIEMYEDSINYDESKDGPRPDDVYPVEKIDYLYYLTNGFQNPIDQLFSSGYLNEIYKTTLHESGYTPSNSAAKPVSIKNPVKLMVLLIKDKMKTTKRHNGLTLKECEDYLRNNFYDWFMTQLREATPLEEIAVDAIEDVDEAGEDDEEPGPTD